MMVQGTSGQLYTTREFKLNLQEVVLPEESCDVALAYSCLCSL